LGEAALVFIATVVPARRYNLLLLRYAKGFSLLSGAGAAVHFTTIKKYVNSTKVTPRRDAQG
jgi:hypothetical protein